VVEPVGVILEAVEVVERRATSRVVAARASPVGVDGPLKFIPIKSSAATGSGAPGSYAEHSRFRWCPSIAWMNMNKR